MTTRSANAVRRRAPAAKDPGEVRFLRRQWVEGRPFAAIVAEMLALGWSAAEIDVCLAQVAGPRLRLRAQVLEGAIP